MSNTNNILKKIVTKQKTGLKKTPVKLSALDDNINNYKEIFAEYNSGKQALYSHLDEVLNASQTMLSLNKELSKIYWIHDEIFNKAAEIGVQDLLPDVSMDIFNLDVMAGLSSVDNKLEKISDFCLQYLQDEFSHD